MAVYTKLSDNQIAEIINDFNVGEFASATPITAGIENSNYLIQTDSGKYIFTIFENRVENTELPFFVELTDHLKNNGINCPKNLTNKNGERLVDVAGKKAALISFLNGAETEVIGKNEAAELGHLVGSLHLAVKGFDQHRKNPMSMRAWVSLLEKMSDKLDDEMKETIADEIYHLADAWPFGLPSGVVHADIFPDNVFFQNGKISGVIDFYFSCTDFFAYDLAICINAWGFDEAMIAEFIKAYETHRKLEKAEKQSMQTLLRGAALRFLLTRLYDWHNTPDDAIVNKKDPNEYLEKLKFWQNSSFIY